MKYFQTCPEEKNRSKKKEGSVCLNERKREHISWRINQISRKHRCVMEKIFNSTGVFQGQHKMLMCISDNNFYSQKEIAAHMKISTATVAVSLKKLEKGGYIKKIVDENDNRLNKIVLTDKAKSVVEYSRQVFDNMEETMFKGFSTEEKEQLIEYLERIEGNLKNEG